MNVTIWADEATHQKLAFPPLDNARKMVRIKHPCRVSADPFADQGRLLPPVQVAVLSRGAAVAGCVDHALEPPARQGGAMGKSGESPPLNWAGHFS